MNNSEQSTTLSWDDGSHRLALLLEYDGTGFSGSQYQPNALSVQETLEEAFNKLQLTCPRRICLSGRTDSGVHAKGQVAHMDVMPGGLENISDLKQALNAFLPLDQLIITDIIDLDQCSEFHARFSAQWRWYQYRILNTPELSLWHGKDMVWIKGPLNITLMNQAAQFLLGEHWFDSFQSTGSKTENTLCNVLESHFTEEPDSIITYNIIANRFLYKMVRNIVGTLMAIGHQKRFTPEDIPAILEQRNRQCAGITAQPQGLSLMAVAYPPPWDFFHNTVYGKTLQHRLQESRHEENLLRQA